MPLPCWATATCRRNTSTTIDSRPSLRVSLLPSRTAAALPTPSGPKGSSGNRRCRVSGPQKTATVPRCGFLRPAGIRTSRPALKTKCRRSQWLQRQSLSVSACTQHALLIQLFCRFVLVNHHVHLINAAHFIQVSAHGLFCKVRITFFKRLVYTNVGAV